MKPTLWHISIKCNNLQFLKVEWCQLLYKLWKWDASNYLLILFYRIKCNTFFGKKFKSVHIILKIIFNLSVIHYPSQIFVNPFSGGIEGQLQIDVLVQQWTICSNMVQRNNHKISLVSLPRSLWLCISFRNSHLCRRIFPIKKINCK